MAGLLVKAWVATNRVEAGGIVPFWILFENESQGRVSNLHFLQFSQPDAGFSPHGSCWDTGQHFPICVDGERRTFSESIAAGDSVVVNAELRAKDDTGIFEPTGVFEWIDAANHRHRDVVALGPIHVISELEERTVALGRRLLAILRDIALPLIILVAGLRFQAVSQRQAEANQTRQGFLTRMLADAQKHYLPAMSRLQRLHQQIGNLATASGLKPDESLWSLLRFMCQMSRMVNRIGGVQFKNRWGEEVVGQYYSTIHKATEAHLGIRNLSFAVREMATDEPFVTFLERFESTAPPQTRSVFEKIREDFVKWIHDPDDPLPRYAPVVDGFMTALSFEINAPFVFWYDEPEPFPKKQFEVQLGVLRQPFPELAKSLEQYLKRRA